MVKRRGVGVVAAAAAVEDGGSAGVEDKAMMWRGKFWGRVWLGFGFLKIKLRDLRLVVP